MGKCVGIFGQSGVCAGTLCRVFEATIHPTATVSTGLLE